MEEGFGQQLTFRKVGKKQAGEKNHKNKAQRRSRKNIEAALTAEPREQYKEKDFV